LQPHPFSSLEIVRNAKDKVTIVITKNKDALDVSSIDEFVLPSLPDENVQEVVNGDGSYIKTREIINHDGSHTTIAEFFELDGRKHKQTTSRKWLEFDGTERDISFSSLDADGEMVIFVKKTIPSDTVGLRLENQRTHRGQNAIVVSQVFPSGLFARTPLSVGDVVLSINDIDFRVDPNVEIAAEALARSKSGVKVIAIKPNGWIERRHQRISQPRQLVETFIIDPPKSKAYQFDDSAYDDSVFGYNSTKKVSLKDFSASERLGLIIESQYTRLGVLLVAKEVSSSSRLAGLGLKNGDIILSINGVDMKREPDASRAMSLFRNSEKGIEIEYQRLRNLTEAETKNIPVARMESFLPDGTKCIRTETRNPDGSVLVRIEEVTPANPIDAALPSVEPINGFSGDPPHVLTQSRSHFTAVATGSSTGRSTLEPVTVTVTKSNRSQYVGIDLVVVNDTLCVAGVGKNGLLLGKPVLPGDTVLEINGHDFRRNPSARRAQSILSNATKSIRFTILRTSMLKGLHRDKSTLPSRRVSLNCFKCKKRSDNDEVDDRASKNGTSN
jgi:C-terminal processing protease CtpA/Prc